MAKRSSDSRVAYPEVKVYVRDLVRIVGIVAPFAPRVVGTCPWTLPGSPVSYRCLGHQAQVSCAPFTPWVSINRILPENRLPVGQRVNITDNSH